MKTLSLSLSSSLKKSLSSPYKEDNECDKDKDVFIMRTAECTLYWRNSSSWLRRLYYWDGSCLHYEDNWLSSSMKKKCCLSSVFMMKISSFADIILALCSKNFQNMNLRSTIQEFVCHLFLREMNFGKIWNSKIAILQFQKFSTLNFVNFGTWEMAQSY